ncbi:MAG: nucleotidyltransferase family protein [Paucibacter sp.]|nr:nucleotidyltransferase family protein [Roseateles sp.]
MTERRTAIVVLAAGQGARFKGRGHKMEQAIGPDDRALLGSTLQHAMESGLRVLVVTTPELAPLALGQLAARDVVVMPPGGPRGMGHSIAAGVGVAGDADGWLILPGDMPLVQPDSIQAVAKALEQYPIAYAQYRGRRGHPVGFSAEFYSELLELSGDEGARRLVARYPAQAVEVEDAGVLVDVDTTEDLARLRETLTPLTATQR